MFLSIKPPVNLLMSKYREDNEKSQIILHPKKFLSHFNGLNNALNYFYLVTIFRYFTEPPRKRGFDIINGSQFKEANQVFQALCKEVHRVGKGKVTHKPVITPGDLKKLETYFTDLNSPTILLHKVWFDMMLYFCRRGREGQRELTVESFAVNIGDDGRKFIIQPLSEVTKNYQGVALENEPSGGVMVETGGPLCPVKSFELYLSLRNKSCAAFFQRPFPHQTRDERWYMAIPLGKNSLSTMMSRISKSANLSKAYTNHCIRATSITALNDAGYDSRHIMSVSKHKSECSIRSYCQDASAAQKSKMSATLSKVIQPPYDQVSIVDIPNPSNATADLSSSDNISQMLDDPDLDFILSNLPDNLLQSVNTTNTIPPTSQSTSNLHSLAQSPDYQGITATINSFQNSQLPFSAIQVCKYLK